MKTKKYWLTIILYLILLSIYVFWGFFVTSMDWYQDASDLQKGIFVTGCISSFIFTLLFYSTLDLVALIPLRKLFKR